MVKEHKETEFGDSVGAHQDLVRKILALIERCPVTLSTNFRV